MLADRLSQHSGGIRKLELSKQCEMVQSLIERGPRFSVKAGEFDTSDQLIAALDAAEVKIPSSYVRTSLLPRIMPTQTQEKNSVESFRVTPSGLGHLRSITRRGTIDTEAGAIGFGLLPREYAALVALKCARQLQTGETCDLEVGEWLVVASEPIVDSAGGRILLYVYRYGDGVYLGWGCGDPGSKWSPDTAFLFRRK